MKNLQIGKIYCFDYESSSKSNYEKIYAHMNDELRSEIVSYLKKNSKACLSRYEKQYKKALEIVNAKNKNLKDELKKEFYEEFGNNSEKTEKTKARELFIRNYNPDKIEFNDDGKIKAIFAGYSATVTGKTTYKWYVLSDLGINKKYYTEELSSFVNVIQ
jgi:hypothetical protein